MDGSSNISIVVYEPDQRVRMGFIQCWIFMVKNIIRSRDLIWQLFKRDFLSGYKQSLLGLFWIVFSPIIGIFSWVFMNYTGILNPGDVGVPYPVYVLFGSTMWGLFMSIYSASAASLSSGGSLIVQVNFSHEALVAQQIAQTIANFIVNLLTLIFVFGFFAILPSWKVVFFPFTLIPLFFLGSGIGMVVSVLAVVVHDFTKMVTTILGFLMFLAPVIYTPNFHNDILQMIIWWNPLTYLVGGTRDIVLYGRIDYFDGYLWATLFSIVLFLLSWRLFFLSEQKVAEKF